MNHANSWHADYFIFTFVSPSLKFTIFHSFTVQYDLHIADSSCMQDASNMNLLYIYSLTLHPWVLLSSSGLRAPAKWLGGHRLVSCRELRFFSLVCPTLVTCSLFHFHICFTEWKFTIFHSFVTYIILNPFLHITLHFMFWHELYIPFTQKAKHYTPVPV